MRLPARLSRRKKDVHKNSFGHVLIIAGSRRMLGAAALCGLASMRSGAGLVTVAVPKSLNNVLQKKLAPVIMTLPLPETRSQMPGTAAYRTIADQFSRYSAVAIGPGLGRSAATQKFVLSVIRNCPQPLVIDADALNILSHDLKTLSGHTAERVLTPHPGEMARLTGMRTSAVERHRKDIALAFALKNKCVLLLKGHLTIVASAKGKAYLNKTGNSGMATAGSGDVLTGMIAAFLAQGLTGFEAAKLGAYLHGLAGDHAAEQKGRISLIATDILESIPAVLQGQP